MRWAKVWSNGGLGNFMHQWCIEIRYCILLT